MRMLPTFLSFDPLYLIGRCRKAFRRESAECLSASILRILKYNSLTIVFRSGFVRDCIFLPVASAQPDRGKLTEDFVSLPRPSA